MSRRGRASVLYIVLLKIQKSETFVARVHARAKIFVIQMNVCPYERDLWSISAGNKRSSAERDGATMSNIFARASSDRAKDMRAKPNGPACMPLNLTRRDDKRLRPPGRGNQELLKRLQAENAKLRNQAVDLALQIQVLRDDGAPRRTFKKGRMERRTVRS